jgi:hypothetical protein
MHPTHRFFKWTSVLSLSGNARMHSTLQTHPVICMFPRFELEPPLPSLEKSMSIRIAKEPTSHESYRCLAWLYAPCWGWSYGASPDSAIGPCRQAKLQVDVTIFNHFLLPVYAYVVNMLCLVLSPRNGTLHYAKLQV